MDLYRQLEETKRLLEERTRISEESTTTYTSGIEFEDMQKEQSANTEYIRILEEQKERLENEIKASILERTRDWNLQTGEYRAAEIEHVRETRNKGIFGRIGVWFKRHFSSSSRNATTMAPVEKDVTIHSSRFLLEEERIKRLRSDEEIAKQEAKTNLADETAVMKARYGGARPALIRRGKEDHIVELQEIEDLFVSNGWSLVGKEVPNNIDDEKEKVTVIKHSVGRFCRELGSARVDASYEKVKKEGTFVYQDHVKPLTEVKNLLKHRDEAHIKDFIQDILDFSMKDVYRKYPIHEMTAEQRLENFPVLEEMSYRLNAQCQLAQKFFKHEVGPELRRQIDDAACEISIFQLVVKRIGVEGTSYKDYYRKVISGIDESKEYQAYEANYKRISAVASEGTGGLLAPNRILLDSVTEKDIVSFAKSFADFAMITKTGRPRLLGNEPAGIINKFAADDIAYYSGLEIKGQLISGYLDKHPEAADKVLPEGLTAETINKYALCSSKANKALNKRLTYAGLTSVDAVESAAILQDDRYWYLDRMNQDAEKLGISKIAFEGQEPEMTEEKLAEREKTLNILGPKSEALFAAYTRIQDKISQENYKPDTTEKTIIKACRLYCARVYGPADLFKSLMQEVGDNFTDKELKTVLDVCEYENMHGNVCSDNNEYLQANMLDVRVMSTLAPGYKVDADGQAVYDEARKNKAAATEFIHKYQEDKEYRLSFVKSTIEECLNVPFTKEMLTPEYIGEHFLELRIFSMKNMLIQNLMNDSRNAEYINKMSKEEQEHLHDIGDGLGTLLGHVLRYYSAARSFQVGNGPEILDADRQEGLVMSQDEVAVRGTIELVESLLEKRNKGFTLPDIA